jgi:endoglucanase Acf2
MIYEIKATSPKDHKTIEFTNDLEFATDWFETNGYKILEINLLPQKVQ